MAQFRATIQGQRGEASRLGHKSSGITAKVNGWNGGVRVEARHSDGKDWFEIFATGGSNGSAQTKLVCMVDGCGNIVPAA